MAEYATEFPSFGIPFEKGPAQVTPCPLSDASLAWQVLAILIEAVDAPDIELVASLVPEAVETRRGSPRLSKSLESEPAWW